VCRDGEASHVRHSGQLLKVCNENVLRKPTLRLSAQAKPTALLATWMAMVIISEQLQIPVVLSDPEPKRSAVDFFRWTDRAGSCEAHLFSGVAYDWAGLNRAATDPSCRSVNSSVAGGPTCTHAMLEVWHDVVAERKASVRAGYAQDLGPNGMISQVGLYVAGDANTALGGITHLRLRDRSFTRHFKEPKTFQEYCALSSTRSQAGYSESLCHYVYVTQANDPLVAASLQDLFFVAELPQIISSRTNRTFKANWYDKVYPGHFVPVADDKAWVAEPPCSWETYVPLQMRYGSGVAGEPLHVKTRQVTSQQLQSLVDLSGYWMTAMRYLTASGGIPGLAVGNFSAWVSSRPLDNMRSASSQWIDNPSFHPVIFWHERPGCQHERWQFEGVGYKLDKVPLGEWADTCESARDQGYVAQLKRRRCGADGQLQLNETSLDAFCASNNQDCTAAACDYHPARTVHKMATASLTSHLPEAETFLQRFEMLNSHIQNMAGTVSNAYTNITDPNNYPNPDTLWRGVLCSTAGSLAPSWTDALPSMQRLDLGCRNTDVTVRCSGHGRCEITNSTTGRGTCRCSGGFSGALCEVPPAGAANSTPPAVDYTSTVPQASILDIPSATIIVDALPHNASAAEQSNATMIHGDSRRAASEARHASEATAPAGGDSSGSTSNATSNANATSSPTSTPATTTNTRPVTATWTMGTPVVFHFAGNLSAS
jgi:hypothetical protein